MYYRWYGAEMGTVSVRELRNYGGWSGKRVVEFRPFSGLGLSAQALDGLITATPLANDLPPYTRSAADFAVINGREVVEASEDS